MVKGFIGVGILALPSGFSKSGWLGGILCFTICSATILYLSLQLVKVASHRKSNAQSVTEFWVECMGKEYELMANVFLFAIQLGICIAYMIFFATYFQESLCFFVNNDTTSLLCSSRIPSLIASVCLCAPSIFIRDMANLKHWSMVANALIVFSLIVIIIASLIQIPSSVEPIHALNFSDIGGAVGIFVFAFEGTTLYFEVRHSMHDPDQFEKVLKYSMSGGVILYVCVGFIGYLAFGEKVRDIILFNFSMEQGIFILIQISYCVAILLSYPLQMFPLVSIVERQLLRRIQAKHGYARFLDVEKDPARLSQQQQQQQQQQQASALSPPIVSGNMDESDEKNLRNKLASPITSGIASPNTELTGGEQVLSTTGAASGAVAALSGIVSASDEELIQEEFMKQSTVLRIGSLLVVVVIATLFKQISTFLNLIGSLSGCFFCFILPVLTYYKSMPDAPKNVLQLHWGLMSMGIFFSLVGTYSSLKELFSADPNSTEPTPIPVPTI